MEKSISNKEHSEEHCRNGFRLAWVENNHDAALKEFQTALQLWPDNPQAHCQIGEILFFASNRNLADALKEFEHVTRVAPDWAEGHLWHGNTLQEMERYEEAESAYNDAARLMPSDARAHISLGGCPVKLGKFAPAVAAFRRGIALKPAYGEMSARMMLADALRKNGQLEEALSEWKTVANMEAVWDYERGEPERAKAFLAQYG